MNAWTHMVILSLTIQHSVRQRWSRSGALSSTALSQLDRCTTPDTICLRPFCIPTRIIIDRYTGHCIHSDRNGRWEILLLQWLYPQQVGLNSLACWEGCLTSSAEEGASDNRKRHFICISTSPHWASHGADIAYHCGYARTYARIFSPFVKVSFIRADRDACGLTVSVGRVSSTEICLSGPIYFE